MAAKYTKVSNNTINFYVIADSSGNLPSDETRININSDITSLIGAEGANVGDIFVIGKLNLLPVYKIIPLNDAKAANADYKGTQGVVTPWDKTQINKVPNLESALNSAKNNLPTRTESNMNNALQTGFYPWCTLGRPAGSTGAYTLVTLASSTADSSGYTTIEQTAYGRQDDELGKIFKRIIFKKNSEVQLGEWKEITSVLTKSGLIVDDKTGERELSVCVNNPNSGFRSCLTVAPEQAFLYTGNKKGYGFVIDYSAGFNFLTKNSNVRLNVNNAMSLGVLTKLDTPNYIFKRPIKFGAEEISLPSTNRYVQKRFFVSGFKENLKYALFLNGKNMGSSDLRIGLGSTGRNFTWFVVNGVSCFKRDTINPNNITDKTRKYGIMATYFSAGDKVKIYYVDVVVYQDGIVKIYIKTETPPEGACIKNTNYELVNGDIRYIGKSIAVSLNTLRDIVLNAKRNRGGLICSRHNNNKSKIKVYGLKTRYRRQKKGYYMGSKRKHTNWSTVINYQNIIKVVFFKGRLPIKSYILKYDGDSFSGEKYNQIPTIIG